MYFFARVRVILLLHTYPHDALPIYHYVGPQWAECRAFINSVILDHLEQPCVAVTILNQHYCEENPLQPAPDPTDPEYTPEEIDRKSTRLNSSHVKISYAVFCLKNKI